MSGADHTAREAAIRRVRALREIRVDRGATPAEEDAACAAIERIAKRYDLSSEDISPRAVPQAPPRPPGWYGPWPPPGAPWWNGQPTTTQFFGGAGGYVTIIINW